MSFVSASAPTNGLVGYWNFDEGSGTVVADSSVSGNNGTINGTTWTTGKVGSGALSFDGVNDFVLGPNISSLFTNQEATFSAWVKKTEHTGSVNSETGSWYFNEAEGNSSHYPYTDGTIYDGSFKTTRTTVGAGIITDRTQWHMVTITRKAGANGWNFYQNGQLVTSADGGTWEMATNWAVGKSFNSSVFFKGSIDDVRIYNRVLSASEILDVYNDIGVPATPTIPSISSFTSSPSSIPQGQSSILSWNVSGTPTPTLSINSGVGTVTGGSVSVSPSVTASYILTATNSQGTITAQTTVTVTAPPPPDTQAPTVPTNLTATAVSSSAINLSWTASTDNIAVTGYRIYRGGSQIGTSASNSYSDSGLTASTNYSYTVAAYDAAVNVSAQSISASVTTQDVVTPPPPPPGTCLAVTPAGSGNRSGSDWSNAMAGLPATLARGRFYYLADGNYPYYTFNTPVSGTQFVTIRKAQSYDHCADTGWNETIMGSSQAVFTGFYITSSYFTLDGNGIQTAPGCGGAPGATVTGSPPNPKDCGIKIATPTNQGMSFGSGVGNYHVRYLEELGNGINNGGLAEFFAPLASSVSSFLHIYAHNAGCVFFQYGGNQREVGFSYFWGTETDGAPTGSCHGQYSFYAGNDSNSVEHDNVYRDITGTAVWTFALGSGTHTNWSYYNNVIFNSSPTVSWNPFLSDGILACINSGVNCMHEATHFRTQLII